MEEFKKKLQRQQILLLSGFLLSCSAIMLTRNFIKDTVISENLQGFIDGFQISIALMLLSVLAIFFVKNIIAMKNPAQLKKLYISETDERKLFIKQKSGSVGMNFIVYGLTLGTAVAGNINYIVFLTLLGACLFVALVRVFLKLYYRNKY